MSHIHIFGSVCYCHVHADNRKKLDPSGEKGLLVGCNEISKAYRVYFLARSDHCEQGCLYEDRALRKSLDL